MGFPPCPDVLKPIAHYLKIADEHDSRDIIISYWCRLHALEIAMKISQQKTPEVSKLLLAIMDWLESTKKEHSGNEGITSKLCAQATVENYALKLFAHADQLDRAENYGKNVVKAFYTSGILMDVLEEFGELSEDIIEKRKYAKWKAAYIHNCLKSGERPVPGPPGEEDSEDFLPVNDEQKDPGMLPFTNPMSPLIPGVTGAGGWNPVPNILDPFPSVPSDSNSTSFNTEPTTPMPSTSPDTSPQNQFTPYAPAPMPSPASNIVNIIPSTGSVNLGAEQIAKAQKYCKWASSALNYDDIKTAIDNLQRALVLLQTGKEAPE